MACTTKTTVINLVLRLYFTVYPFSCHNADPIIFTSWVNRGGPSISKETKRFVNCRQSDRISKSVSNEAENLETHQCGRSKEPLPGKAATVTIIPYSYIKGEITTHCTGVLLSPCRCSQNKIFPDIS